MSVKLEALHELYAEGVGVFVFNEGETIQTASQKRKATRIFTDILAKTPLNLCTTCYEGVDPFYYPEDNRYIWEGQSCSYCETQYFLGDHGYFVEVNDDRAVVFTGIHKTNQPVTNPEEKPALPKEVEKVLENSLKVLNPAFKSLYIKYNSLSKEGRVMNLFTESWSQTRLFTPLKELKRRSDLKKTYEFIMHSEYNTITAPNSLGASSPWDIS